MSDGDDFDYRRLTRAQLEYALKHIDGTRFPKNLANARAALEARNAGTSPEPVPLLDAATDARYTYWAEKFLGALIAGYAVLGLSFDDLIFPAVRRLRIGIIHLHGPAAWIGALALAIAASIPFFGGLTNAEPPAIRPRFRVLLRIAVALIVIAFLVGPVSEIA